MIGIITLNSQYIVVIKEVVIRSPFCKFTLFRQHFNDQKLQSYIHHSRATECLQSNSVVQIMQFLLSRRDPFMVRRRLINPSFMLIETDLPNGTFWKLSSIEPHQYLDG